MSSTLPGYSHIQVVMALSLLNTCWQTFFAPPKFKTNYINVHAPAANE